MNNDLQEILDKYIDNIKADLQTAYELGKSEFMRQTFNLKKGDTYKINIPKSFKFNNLEPNIKFRTISLKCEETIDE